MFEVTADDIARLGDKNMRSLVGLLCESEMRRRRISPSCVTYGGHQDAGDGGVDVRVALPPNLEGEGFIPRPASVFQVKAERMPRSTILSEMRPEGALRPIISELAEQSGAYIIVSSEATSHTSLRSRIRAMREAVSDDPNSGAVTLDFYDRTRIETWLRDHIGTTLWVREKIGKEIQGWRSYGDWSKMPKGADSKYLLDARPRLKTGKATTEPNLTALEGINLIRSRLREAGAVVRLVGLSGTGKTRFVQALFDSKVGEASLDPDLAAYTDVADQPEPGPMALQSELIATQKPGILVIDNCPPDLHRRLSESCRSAESNLSLMTIEYDVRDDITEGTDVFILGDNSVDLIENLLSQRFQTVSPINIRRIAEFSGGNARIALAVAGTIETNETIAGLSDTDLFERLFHQRHRPDQSLLFAAQALSLVYSFDGDDVSDDENAELHCLGVLVGRTPQEMFQFAADLESRDLLQRRSKWRAILPPAIADRLAATALQRIPMSAVNKCFINGAEHSLISFTRRLNSLHTSKEAQAIAREWLSPIGLLGNIPELDSLGKILLRNLAPVDPNATLAALERAISQPGDHGIFEKCAYCADVIRCVAYDADLFDRCIALLVMVAATVRLSNNAHDPTKILASLFPLYASGTHASLAQREKIIWSLLASGEGSHRELGLAALRASLETVHFGAVYGFEFGARPRNYGYHPKSPTEVKDWYKSVLKLAESVACSHEPASDGVRNVLAEQFRGLWSRAEMYDDLERLCFSIANVQFWREGWIAVRQTIHFDGKDLDEAVLARLMSLESALRPRSLAQEVRSIVLPDNSPVVGFDSTDFGSDDLAAITSRTEETARVLGQAVASDEGALAELLPELVTGTGQLWNFGLGLAQKTVDADKLWQRLTSQFMATPVHHRRPAVLVGFMGALQEANAERANGLLDEIVGDVALSPFYPLFQAQFGIDQAGLDRLFRSISEGKTPIRSYSDLSALHATSRVPSDRLAALLLAISEKPSGLGVAIELLYMRILSERSQRKPPVPDLVEIGRTLMEKLEFANSDGRHDYRLQVLCKYSLPGEGGEDAVRKICRKLGAAVSKYETHLLHHEDLLEGLFSAQPVAALDGLWSACLQAGGNGARALHDFELLRQNPLDRVPEDEILAWCDQEPATRYCTAATVVRIFRPSQETGRLEWTSTAIRLLNGAPDRIEVLKAFINRFSPSAWTGSRSAIVAGNASLLDHLDTHDDVALASFIATEKVRLAQAAEAEKQFENMIYKPFDESFE